ncbi:MAG: hypothetical protein U0528_16500 [Anaerolineae bacterium]|nr:hypothetical protein [Anaerolineae bacterium]
MVKQAEKLKKVSPLLPIYGLVVAVGLAVVARLLVDPVLKVLPELNSALLSSGYPYETMKWVVAGAMWIVFIGLAYFLVALISGKDPTSPKYLPPLPERDPKKRRD